MMLVKKNAPTPVKTVNLTFLAGYEVSKPREPSAAEGTSHVIFSKKSRGRFTNSRGRPRTGLNRRGRPRHNRPMHDTGTPELVMKRALGATTESLDLCLERGIITHQQHWCGIHLRWLYTLRFGAPGVRAMDPTHMGGVDVKADDPKWRAAREVEYLEAITLLRGSAAALLAVVVHNERPEFLNHRPECFSGNAEKRINASMINFTKGLDTLCVLWCTPNVKS